MCVFHTLRVLSALNESLLPPIVSCAFECLQELRIGFLSVFLFFLSLPFGLLLLLFSLGFALTALCVLAELVLVDLLWLWLVSVGLECTSEREVESGHRRTGRAESSSSSSSKKAASLDFVLSMM